MRFPFRTAVLVCALPALGVAQVVVDAGPDQNVTFPNKVLMHAAVSGGIPLEYWAGDGNGAFEDSMAMYHSVNGLTSIGPLRDAQGTIFPWPTDWVWIDNVLYGHDNFHYKLYTLDLTTAIVTPIGNPHPQWNSVHSMAYDEVGQRLFAVEMGGKMLLRINPADGKATIVPGSNLSPYSLIRSLAWDAANNRLIAEDTGKEQLITIDPNTGMPTYLMESFKDPSSRVEELTFFEGELYAGRGLQNPPQPGDPPGGVAPIAAQLQHIDLATGLFTNMGPVLMDVQPHSLVVRSVPEAPHWSQTGGPGIATIANPRDPFTKVSFDMPGTYVLTLTVLEGGVTPVSDDVLVNVTQDVTTYCTAKINSCGTTPAIGATGTPSASATSGFTVFATNAKGGKQGIVIYTDLGRRLPATPFGQGGYLCIDAPRRAPIIFASGTPPACDGVYAYDMNSFAKGLFGGNPKAFLKVPGTTVNVQFWGRDTFVFGNFLSDALEYVVGP